jgi:hypothetical protein
MTTFADDLVLDKLWAIVAGASRVVDGGQVAKQGRGFGWLQGIGASELGDGQRDPG